MNAEEVKVGCFQVVIVLLLAINYVIVAMSHALPAFHNHTPKFYCQMRNSTNRVYGCQESRNVSVGGNSTSGLQESHDLASCAGTYHFATEFEENSVVMEWRLICEKRHLTLLGPTVYYIGVLIGAWISGLLADRIGRLPVQAICLYTQGTMAVALYVVQNYPTFLAIRGLQGVFVQGLQNSTYILSLELFPAKARTFVALVMQIGWAIGLVLLATLSYVIPDWRILQLAISVPTAITVLYIWIIPESPRWLLAKGKMTEADLVLERIAKYNVCCTRSRREDIAKVETVVNESLTPIKPERKSRLSSADLKKTKSDDETKEEATNLLTNTETAQQKVRKLSLKAASDRENRLSNVETKKEAARSENGEVERKEVPSSSKCHRKSKSMSQPACNQRLSLKSAYEAVELRTPAKKERLEEIVEKVRNEVEARSKERTKQGLVDALKCSALRMYSVVMICQWFTSSMAFYLFMTFAPKFPVNRHITFASGGSLEIATYVFLYFVLSRYGRRLPMSVYQSVTGVTCIFVAAIIILGNPTNWIVSDLTKNLVLLFGRIAVTSTVSVAYLYTVEIFPTVIRGTCLGLCTVFANIGNLFAAHVLLSGRYMPVTVPFLVIGMLCLVSGALALALPETLNKVLPDTIQDTELLVVNTRQRSSKEPMNNEKTSKNEDLTEREVLRTKLFSEDWVDAGNGILVNFSDNKPTE